MDDGAETVDFSEWLTRLLPELRGVARRLTSNAADAAELVQNTCLRALNKRQLFVKGASDGMRKWLTRIMTNLYYDLVRKSRFEKLLGEMDDVVAPDPTPPAWTRVSDEEVTAAVERLGLPLRSTYHLFAVEQYSYTKISEHLRIAPSTVATRIFRARAHLRKTLGVEEALHEAA
jgi:RNA polymerase sigma-70 factor (ECF subfamily)